MIQSYKTDRLDKKTLLINKALKELGNNKFKCHLCPRNCGVSRYKGEKGICGVENLAVVSHSCMHFGEEPCLSGYYDFKEDQKTKSFCSGSGAVFFSGCNLRCNFCQNYQISWKVSGSPCSSEKLASVFLSLQEQNALNINLITPTHIIIPILESLRIAFANGLSIPLVYNTSAYENLKVLSKLTGIIDIYLPDLKYFRTETAKRFSNAPDYPEKAKDAVKEMYRQVGNLELDSEGNAKGGLIVRHLILPGYAEEACEILDWIAANLSNKVCLSLMSQYFPCNEIMEDINRGISADEYNTVLDKAVKLGFENVYIQSNSFQPEDHLIPDFERRDVFTWNQD